MVRLVHVLLNVGRYIEVKGGLLSRTSIDQFELCSLERSTDKLEWLVSHSGERNSTGLLSKRLPNRGVVMRDVFAIGR